MSAFRPSSAVTVEELRACVAYDPDSGEFTSALTGCKVGFAKAGYVRLVVRGGEVRAHRAAWALMTGAWPAVLIDHIDNDPANNRWANLRMADKSRNAVNSRRRKDNSSGYTGVSWSTSSRKWQARICVRGRQMYVGFYETKEQAHAAYVQAANAEFGEFVPARHRIDVAAPQEARDAA